MAIRIRSYTLTPSVRRFSLLISGRLRISPFIRARNETVSFTATTPIWSAKATNTLHAELSSSIKQKPRCSFPATPQPWVMPSNQDRDQTLFNSSNYAKNLEHTISLKKTSKISILALKAILPTNSFKTIFKRPKHWTLKRYTPLGLSLMECTLINSTMTLLLAWSRLLANNTLKPIKSKYAKPSSLRSQTTLQVSEAIRNS